VEVGEGKEDRWKEERRRRGGGRRRGRRRGEGGEEEGGEGEEERGEGGRGEGRERRGGRTRICHVHCTVNFSYSTDHILSDCKNMSGKAYSKLSLHKD